MPTATEGKAEPQQEEKKGETQGEQAEEQIADSPEEGGVACTTGMASINRARRMAVERVWVRMLASLLKSE